MEFNYEADVRGDLRPVAGVLFYQGASLLNPLDAPVKCLLDTGARHTFLRWEMADAFGLDLDNAEDHPDLKLGGETRTGIKVVHLELEISDGPGNKLLPVPSTPVLFIKGELPHAGLLGASALRCLVVVFREYEGTVNVRPARDFMDSPHATGAYPL